MVWVCPNNLPQTRSSLSTILGPFVPDVASFGRVTIAGVYRVVINPPRCNSFPPIALNGVVNPHHKKDPWARMQQLATLTETGLPKGSTG